MGRTIVIAAAVVIIALIIAGVTSDLRRRQSRESALAHGWATVGDLNARQERKLREEIKSAANIMRSLLGEQSWQGDFTILSAQHRKQIEHWLSSSRVDRQHTRGLNE